MAHPSLSGEQISWNVETIANAIIDHRRQISHGSLTSSVFVLRWGITPPPPPTPEKNVFLSIRMLYTDLFLLVTQRLSADLFAENESNMEKKHM